MDIEIEEGRPEQHPLLRLDYPLQSMEEKTLVPTLNKIASFSLGGALYCGYSDGKILHYDTHNHCLLNVYSVYDNTDIIDI